jgi:hypothetical protein
VTKTRILLSIAQKLSIFGLFELVLLLAAAAAQVQYLSVALTFDDLPAAQTRDPREAEPSNRDIVFPRSARAPS